MNDITKPKKETKHDLAKKRHQREVDNNSRIYQIIMENRNKGIWDAEAIANIINKELGLTLEVSDVETKLAEYKESLITTFLSNPKDQVTNLFERYMFIYQEAMQEGTTKGAAVALKALDSIQKLTQLDKTDISKLFDIKKTGADLSLEETIRQEKLKDILLTEVPK